jgi:glucuronosyltransferase
VLFSLQEMHHSFMHLLLLYAVCSTEAARILRIFPTPSISHQLPFQAIMKALAARGHQVTVISPNPLKVCVLKFLFGK